MSGKKNGYSNEFKLEVIKKLLTSEISVTELSRDLNIPESTIRTWRNNYFSTADNNFIKRAEELDPQSAEIIKLRKELENKNEECEILKKAIAIFSDKQKK